MLQVEIRVKAHMDKSWSEWFQDLQISHCGENETLLHGVIHDQAALYGLIARFRDLGLPLLSVTCKETGRQN